MTAWCDSRFRRWCRTQLMREMLATMMQIHLVVCWKMHQWVCTAVSVMCLTSSKYADIAFFESVIREVGEQSVSLEDTTTVWNWLWTACSTNNVSYSSCVDFRGPKSVAPVDDFTSSSSLNPPATTISLATGACEHNSSDTKCARSALLSANDRKFDQFFGRGTSRPFTSRLIGRAVLVCRVLVVPLIVSSLYLSNTTSIMWYPDPAFNTVFT